MKALRRNLTIWASLLGLGLIGLGWAWKGDFRRAMQDGHTPLDAGHHVTRRERVDDDHDPARFDTLSGVLKSIALELEGAAAKWQRNRPPGENWIATDCAWKSFSMERISKLETHQIQALAEWMTVDGVNEESELHEYRQAVFKIWASRKPEATRGFLLGIAEKEGFLGMKSRKWRDEWLEEVADNFHFMRVGHAMKAPKAAWEEFVRDDSNPDMMYLIGDYTITDLFKEYASKLPEEAWELGLSSTNETYVSRMLEGFANGVAGGQDWEELGRDLQDSLAARKI